MAVNDPTDSPALKLDQAKIYKAEGNDCFKSGSTKKAISKYHRALLYTRGIEEGQKKFQHIAGAQVVPLPEDMQNEVDSLKTDCYNNLANCLLQGEAPDYAKIVQYCENVLQVQPHNIKALYRKGFSLLQLKNVDEAMTVLTQALNLDPKDPKIRKCILQCQEESKRQDSHMKANYKNMFGKMAIE